MLSPSVRPAVVAGHTNNDSCGRHDRLHDRQVLLHMLLLRDILRGREKRDGRARECGNLSSWSRNLHSNHLVLSVRALLGVRHGMQLPAPHQLARGSCTKPRISHRKCCYRLFASSMHSPYVFLERHLSEMRLLGFAMLCDACSSAVSLPCKPPAYSHRLDARFQREEGC